MTGIYSTSTPKNLFERLVRRFTAFCENPTEDGLLDVLFPIYHLREWIYPAGYKAMKDKPIDQLSREESFYSMLYEMPEYQVIRSLCNAAKHYMADDLHGRTHIFQGFRTGMGRVGDSLGVTHFVVDGKDVRSFLWPVFQAYSGYFNEN